MASEQNARIDMAKQDLQWVLEEIAARLNEGLEEERSLDIQSLVGESQRLSRLIGLERIPIRWGEYFKREPFRKHFTCGWPGVFEHPWHDLLSEKSCTKAVSLCLVATGPYEEDEEFCLILTTVDHEELYDPAKSWQRSRLPHRVEGARAVTCLLRRWTRFLQRPPANGGTSVASNGLSCRASSSSTQPAQDSHELNKEELEDIPRLSLRHRQVLVAMLRHFNAVGPDSPSLPTGSHISNVALCGIGVSEPKRILSEMVKFQWLDNGVHHGGQRGYYLTERGVRLANHCYAKRPDAYRYGQGTH